MGVLRNFVNPLHRQTKRNYLERMINEKVNCSKIAKKYGMEYWDGERKFGYGGYKYIPGRWKLVAEELIKTYQLGPQSKVLDVGCGKGFLLHELKLILPGLEVCGIDISDHGLAEAKEEIRPFLVKQKAQDPLHYGDKTFDLVISLGTLHNLRLFELPNALSEIEKNRNVDWHNGSIFWSDPPWSVTRE